MVVVVIRCARPDRMLLTDISALVFRVNVLVMRHLNPWAPPFLNVNLEPMLLCPVYNRVLLRRVAKCLSWRIGEGLNSSGQWGQPLNTVLFGRSGGVI